MKSICKNHIPLQLLHGICSARVADPNIPAGSRSGSSFSKIDEEFFIKKSFPFQLCHGFCSDRVADPDPVRFIYGYFSSEGSFDIRIFTLHKINVILKVYLFIDNIFYKVKAFF